MMQSWWEKATHVAQRVLTAQSACLQGKGNSSRQNSKSKSSPAARRRTGAGLYTLLLASGFGLSYLYAQTSPPPPITVDINGTVPSTVQAGETIKKNLSGSVNNAPKTTTECTVTSGPSWSWSASVSPPGPSVSIDPPTGEDAVVLEASFPSPGTYTITVNASVGYTSTCGDKGGSGSKTYTVTVTPVYKHWEVPSPIGDKKVTVTNPDGSTSQQIVKDGRMIAPQNQRVSPFSPQSVKVFPGENVWCEVEEATDTDKWTLGTFQGAPTGDEADEVSYEWTCEKGNFLVQNPVTGQWTTSKTATTRAVMYVAPEMPTPTPAPTATPAPTPTPGGDPNAPTPTPTPEPTEPPPPPPITDTLTCTIDDKPLPKGPNETGQRGDSALERTVNITIDPAIEESNPDDGSGGGGGGGGTPSRKKWIPSPAISGGNVIHPAGAKAEVLPSGGLGIELAPASDSDTWTYNGASGTEGDGVNYTWTTSGGTVTKSPTEPWKASWSAPAIPGNYTITCKIDDTPAGVPQHETGKRDDTVITRTINVTVPQKVWDTGKAIGKGTQTVTNPDGSTSQQEIDNGRMIAPQNQRVSPATPARVVLFTGQSLPCEVEAVSDSDHWTWGSLQGNDGDNVKYEWSAQGGTMIPDQSDTKKATWTAPTQTGTYTLTCTIDDIHPPSGIGEYDDGSRDDDAITRTVNVEVVEQPTVEVVGDPPSEPVLANQETDAYLSAFIKGGDPLCKPTSEEWSWSVVSTEKSIDNGQTWAPATATITFDPADSPDTTAVISCPSAGLWRIKVRATVDYESPCDNGTLFGEEVLEVEVVTAKVWDIGNPIGYDEDENGTPIENGRFIQPQDQTATPYLPATLLVKPGEMIYAAVEEATDLDHWTGTLLDGTTIDGTDYDVITYSWEVSDGQLEDDWFPDTYWTVPSDAQPGSTYTLTCTIDDLPTPIDTAAGETGTRDDAPVVRTLTVTVEGAEPTPTPTPGPTPTATPTPPRQPEPCGDWKHKEWVNHGVITWTKNNGDPSPSISNATERRSWSDPCASTTKDDADHSVGYTKESDKVMFNSADGLWYRHVTYRAEAYTDSPEKDSVVSGSHVMPRHWSIPPAISGGNVLQPPGAQKTVAPGGSVDCEVAEAFDKDTWKVTGGGSGQADDSVNYKWKSNYNGGAEDAQRFLSLTNRTTSWTAPSQEGTYKLTCTIDDPWTGEETGVSGDDVGTRNDKPVERTITVRVTTKPSYAEFKIYQDDNDNGELEDGEEKSGEVGGAVSVALEITLGSGQRLVSNNAVVQVKEEHEVDTQVHTAEKIKFDTVFNLGGDTGWQKKDADGNWVDTQETPMSQNNSGEDQHFRKLFGWDTTKKPLGHNEKHSIKVVSVDSDSTKRQLQFQGGSGSSPYNSGPDDMSVEVKNLAITEVTASKGTIDYFKWDPENEDFALHAPEVSFTIEDANPHVYRWTVYFQETKLIHSTGNTDWTSDAYSVSGTSTSAGAVSVDLTDSELVGHLTKGLHPSGPYTYDIRVVEFPETVPTDDSEDGSIDKTQYKQPYNLWIPHKFTDADGTIRDGHQVWLTGHEDEDYEQEALLRANYYLYPNPATGAKGASKLSLVAMDPDLKERATVEGSTTPGIFYNGVDEDGDGKADGIVVYRRSPDDTPGDWRVIFVGLDASGREVRRTHDEHPLIPVNQSRNIPTLVPLNQARLMGVYTQKYPQSRLWKHQDLARAVGLAFEFSVVQDAIASTVEMVGAPATNFFSPNIQRWVRPDAVGPVVHVDTSLISLNPLSPRIQWKYPGHFMEVKATSGIIGTESNTQQIRGYLDWLSHGKGAAMGGRLPQSPLAWHPVRPMLSLIGPSSQQWNVGEIGNLARSWNVYAQKIEVKELLHSKIKPKDYVKFQLTNPQAISGPAMVPGVPRDWIRWVMPQSRDWGTVRLQGRSGTYPN